MPAPFIPTKLYTALGEYVTTVDVAPFKHPVQVLVWGSRIFVFRRLNTGDEVVGQYFEAAGITIAWTEEEKRTLGIH